ncbi:hypothetical protein [Brachybacterium sacelli]|uniref:Uncharacterized protein n=2 Tax=Brachybacterium sacelli TaxID=173364 RepID=A0ABS4X7W9_9MICO|nr:hypothetical protein [Brachybacterium sacelli]MBP2384468.1 hypothetical protein [Brachybacterium sacelli]
MDAAFESYRMMRADFELHRHARFLRAHTELRGELLNTAGRAARIDPASLFMGPSSRVVRYASEELKAWFEQHGRITVEEFETQWWNGRDSSLGQQFHALLAEIA